MSEEEIVTNSFKRSIQSFLNEAVVLKYSFTPSIRNFIYRQLGVEDYNSLVIHPLKSNSFLQVMEDCSKMLAECEGSCAGDRLVVSVREHEWDKETVFAVLTVYGESGSDGYLIFRRG